MGQGPPRKSNQYAIYDCYFGGSGPSTCSGVQNIAPVGSATLGAGRWGQLDMGGEVYEWNLDWSNLYQGGWMVLYADPCVDCAYLPAKPPNSTGRVVRGSSFENGAGNMSAGSTYAGFEGADFEYGFRCARAP
jgi:sulfatase modifying factor 1